MLNFKQLIGFIIFSFCFLGLAQAKEVTLYDQPKEGAAVVGKIDIAAGFVPIYTPANDKTWVKIGDPKNGNVGWVKSAEMGNPGSTSFTVKYDDTPKNSQEYIQRMTQDISKSFENMFKEHQKIMNEMMPQSVPSVPPAPPTK